MQQSASKEQSESKRTASNRLAISGLFAIVIAGVAGYASYKYEFDLALPVAIVAGVIGVGLLPLSFLAKQRAASRERVAAVLAAEIGADWNSTTDLKASKFRNGAPQKVTVHYPTRMPDHDPEWRRKFVELIRVRMQSENVKTTWNEKRNYVRLVAVTIVKTSIDKAREATEIRVHAILNPLFRGVELAVTIPTWNQADELQPERIELRYGVTAVDGSEMWKKRVEAMTGLKLGGRWRAVFDPTKDLGYLEPRPVLPKNVPHPGVNLYENANPKAPMLYYGVDENGTPRGWVIGKKTTMPHMLIIGPTGGGKTTVLRSLIAGAVAQGIYVFAADPKMIELTPFYGFPGCYIASTGEEIAKMIEAMEKLMYDRYDQIKKNPNAADSMRPVLFVLDELLILRQVLKRFHARAGGVDGKPGKGTPPWFDSIAALLALARSALINVVIGVQRPDATLFDDGARDNLRQRLSLMRLSSQGSTMLWGSPYIGVDLPMVQGRAMASPDGENPVELQTFWIADPLTAEGNDAIVLEGFRARATEHFGAITPPVDVSPFVDNMPVFDLDALPRSIDDLVTGGEEDLNEKADDDVTEFDTQNVLADTVTEGDYIVVDGNSVEVTAVEDDPFDDDSVSFVVTTATGEESVAMARNEYVSRVLEMAGVDD
jgi:hypothetical protein